MNARAAVALVAAAGLVLPATGCGGASSSGASAPQSAVLAFSRGDQQKLAFALKVAKCMRAHAFPTYPDPSNATASSQGSGTRFDGTGIDIKSPQFQAAEANCEKHAKEALGLP
jgi:hypothetical protein